MRLLIFTLVFTLISYTSANAQCTGTSISVYDITADSATISWPAPGAVAGYEYAVLPASAAQPSTGTVTINLNIRVGGLVPGQAYKAWHRTNCGGGQYSSWISLSFSTPCGTPGTINIANVKGDSADVSWTQVSPGANYQYYADTLSANPASGTNVNTNSTRLKGLLPGKTYYAFVRTDCGSGVYSPWTSVSFFTKWAAGIISYPKADDFQIYPNPANDVLHINAPDNSLLDVLVYNYTGTCVLHTKGVNRQPINISQLVSGLYLVKIITENTAHTFRIEKH
jgi:hypothetical protein